MLMLPLKNNEFKSITKHYKLSRCYKIRFVDVSPINKCDEGAFFLHPMLLNYGP